MSEITEIPMSQTKFEAAGIKIKTKIEYQGKVFFLVEDKRLQTNLNVFCYENESLLWQIGQIQRGYPRVVCPVSGMRMDRDKLMVYRWCGIEEEINMENGQVISSEFIK